MNPQPSTIDHQPTDVLVVGGGVIGLSIAYEIAVRGASVRLVEQGAVGREASWAGAGILPAGNPLNAVPAEMLRAESHALWPAWSDRLRAETGIDNGFHPCGALQVRFADDDPAWLEREFADWEAEGVEADLVHGSEIRNLEPALAESIGDAVHLPAQGQVRNPRHLKALAAGCLARGVEFVEGTPVVDVVTDGERVVAVRTPAGDIGAGRFCIAGGAWSRTLLERVGTSLDVVPVRGQIVLLRTPRPVVTRVIEHGPRYLVPRPDGRLIVGSTEEHVGFDKRTTAGAIAGLIDFATRLVPDLANAEVERSWAGLRPGSPDRLPFLDRVPDHDNLFVAAGHFRSGLQTSPATARLMSAMILDEPLPFDATPYRFERTRVPV